MKRILFISLFWLLLCPLGCGSDHGPDSLEEISTPNGPVRSSPSIHAVPRDEVWTWVTVDGTRCGQNPEATGLVVNKAARDPEGLLIFMTGGGACWNQLTCESGILAGYIDGFGPPDWAAIAASAAEAGHFGYFDRHIAANPFRNHDMVFVPYCTGDMHTGDTVATYADGHRMFHVGYRNYGLFLDRIVEAFPEPGHVILAGSSAGGYGAIWNYDRTQSAFGATPVYLYADSAVPFGPDTMTDRLQQLWLQAWKHDRNTPPDCGNACGDGRFDSVFRFDLERHPAGRFALDSSVADSVVRSMLSFGFPGLLPLTIPESRFMEGLAEVADDLRQVSNARVFYVDGTFERLGRLDWVNYRTWHVFWKTMPGNPRIRVSGAPNADLAQWLGDFVEGNAEWKDFVPTVISSQSGICSNLFPAAAPLQRSVAPSDPVRSIPP